MCCVSEIRKDKELMRGGEVVSGCSLVCLVLLLLFLPKCPTVLSFSLYNGSGFETLKNN